MGPTAAPVSSMTAVLCRRAISSPCATINGAMSILPMATPKRSARNSRVTIRIITIPAGEAPSSGMTHHPRRSFILAALCACVLCGCSKKETPSAQPTPEQAAQIEADYLPIPENPAQPTTAAAGPAPAAPARPVAAQQINRPLQERLNGAIHAKLTVLLRMYIEKNGRVPSP